MTRFAEYVYDKVTYFPGQGSDVEMRLALVVKMLVLVGIGILINSIWLPILVAVAWACPWVFTIFDWLKTPPAE